MRVPTRITSSSFHSPFGSFRIFPRIFGIALRATTFDPFFWILTENQETRPNVFALDNVFVPRKLPFPVCVRCDSRSPKLSEPFHLGDPSGNFISKVSRRRRIDTVKRLHTFRWLRDAREIINSRYSKRTRGRVLRNDRCFSRSRGVRDGARVVSPTEGNLPLTVGKKLAWKEKIRKKFEKKNKVTGNFDEKNRSFRQLPRCNGAKRIRYTVVVIIDF